MAEWLLEFDRVSYTYPQTARPALHNLTLRIPSGQRVALIGQNGCGKTTLFLLANGLYRPQQGKLFWQSQPFRYNTATLLELRQQVGLVFQNPEQQLVASTVEEDISYGLCNLNLPDAAIAERIEQALLQFDLVDLATTPVHHLSLGQKKRVSLAGVMVLQPKLLLLDEPTAYLDRFHTKQLMALLQTIHQAGTTIVMATHDLDLVYRWADWVFVMDRGQLVLAGTPDTVFDQQAQLEALQLGVPISFELLTTMELLLQSPEFQQTRLSIDQLRAKLLGR
jgi:cobalt/nickel transport system ATP-binding protein